MNFFDDWDFRFLFFFGTIAGGAMFVSVVIAYLIGRV